MKGQVFTVAKLHYVNGVVYEVAGQGTTDLRTLATLSAQTTKSGKVKNPLIRVRTLARLAEGIGLVEIIEKDKVTITTLGKLYFNARSSNKWAISQEQKKILGEYIISDYYRTETIYSITTLYELCKQGYTGKELSHQFATRIGKDNAWKSEVTFSENTQFVLNYVSELGLLNIEEQDLFIETISEEQRYQDDLNIVESTRIPSGKIPRPKSKKFRGTEKYSTNPGRAKIALEKAKFKCELNPDHATFINKKSNQQYMEAHHLIPMSKQGMFEYDIDVPENILSMCPTCHRKVHLAKDNVKKKILFEAFKNRENMLMKRGIVLDINMLLSMYSIE